MSETPTASRNGSPKPSVRSGTRSTPPPSPRSDPKTPAAAPPPSIRRPTITSGGQRRLADAIDESSERSGSGPEVLGRVREQGDVARALERDGQLALVSRAGPRLASRLNLGAFGQIAPEAVDLLVVDLLGLVRAERADLSATAISIEVVALLCSNGRGPVGLD